MVLLYTHKNILYNNSEKYDKNQLYIQMYIHVQYIPIYTAYRHLIHVQVYNSNNIAFSYPC